MADKIVSSGIGQCLLIVVHERRPRGHSIACLRLGYSAQKFSATVGVKNLSAILVWDGIALNAKAPVTVYPKRHVDAAGSLGLFFMHLEENDDQSKPKKKQFEYPINPGSRLVIINYVAASGVFV
ncbi:MAG TPA: hypothetical protein V6C86_02670 [Oculatellaceae cyanobacterium]|jgi:hypothetical protein